MKRYFFRASLDAHLQLAKFYHFMWPSAAALWNLRWQVAGFKSVYPLASEKDYQSRFISGSGIHGASIEQACIRSTWEENQESYAQFLLFQTFGIYESWIAEILDLFSENVRKVEKGLQFPSGGSSSTGVLYALGKLIPSESAFLRDAFYTPRNAPQPFSSTRLDGLLITYRAFKECRNCFAHDGGVVSQQAKLACDAYSALTNPRDLGLTELPVMPSQAVDSPVRLSLRGCVGFTDVVLKIMSTLDAELSRSIKAEKIFYADLKKRISIENQGRLLKSEPRARQTKVRMIIYNLGYPTFVVTEELCEKLKAKGIINY